MSGVSGKSGRPQKYPWSTWLDGQEHEIVIGKDIECSLTTFRANLWKHSSQAKVRTITRCEQRKSGKKTITVLILQSYPKKEVKNEKGKKSQRQFV